MNSWQSVKVQNADSEHAGRAGVVLRTEVKGGSTLYQVKLDQTTDKAEEIAIFAEDELQVLI